MVDAFLVLYLLFFTFRSRQASVCPWFVLFFIVSFVFMSLLLFEEERVVFFCHARDSSNSQSVLSLSR